MALTEATLKAKTVKELKEVAKELGAAATGKKEDIVAAILLAQEAAAAGLEDDGADELADEAAAAAAAAGGAAGAEAGAAAPGKHAAIVFELQQPKEQEHKRANIVGVKALSDAERAQLRAAKFGLATQGGASKPGGGGPAKGAAQGAKGGAGGGVTLEEEIKRLERGIKYGKTSEADKKKLEGLHKKLEAQKEKQRLALDKAELADPDKMAQREKKFGRPLLGSGAAGHKNPKDPELLRKRAEKFGKKVAPPAAAGDDEARKKARLERFNQGN